MKRSVIIFYIAALLLNAPALRTTADNLAFDNPLRKPLLALLSPLSTFSENSHLSLLRTTLQSFERRTLE